VICFVGCAGLTLWLWDRQARMGNGVGEVQGVRVDVATQASGVLVSHTPLPPDPGIGPIPEEQAPFWTHFQRVNKGDVIARLDDTLLRAELVTLEQEQRQLEEQIPQTLAQLELDKWVREHERGRETVQLEVQIETYRIDIAAREAQIAVDNLTVQGLETRVNYYGDLKEAVGATKMDWEFAKNELAVVKERIKGNEKALAESKLNLSAAVKRRDEFAKRDPYPAVVQARIDELLSPLREQISLQQARIEQLHLQIASMVISAPISGEIAGIYHWPGAAVQAGQPIVTIAATDALYLVSYIRPQQRLRPEIGMKVRLRTRHPGSPAFESQIETVGPQVEPVPPQQLADPALPEWGLPVRIPVPQEMNVRPGEVLDIVFPPPNRSG
jgi:multidrug resistance efflux pump